MAHDRIRNILMNASLIILNWNSKELMARNLPSVVAAARWDGGNHEVIVVDNGSNDGSCPWVRANLPDVRLIQLSRNRGFGSGNNHGVQIATGDIVVLLNTDMEVAPNFLSELLPHFACDNVFAVGGKMLKPNGELAFANHTRAKIHGGLLTIDSEFDPTALNEPSEQFHAQGGGSAFHREKFLTLGGFDPLFDPGYWEDVDLSCRAREQGWRIMYEPKSIIYHTEHGSTQGRLLFLIALVHRNRWLFHFKHTANCCTLGPQIMAATRLMLTELLQERFTTLLGLTWTLTKLHRLLISRVRHSPACSLRHLTIPRIG